MQVLGNLSEKDVDGRDEPGYDEKIFWCLERA
jgi:hypothetical protein